MSFRMIAITLFAALLAMFVVTTHAQSTAGGIFGHGPAGAEVTATSQTGVQRHASINAKGRYTLSPLPPGVYAVSLEKAGAIVDTRQHIPLTVGRGMQVDFACENDECAATP